MSAGQTMLVIWQGTAFDVSYILRAIALLIASIVMLRSQMFSKAIAYVGILTSVLMFVPPSAGAIGMVLSLLSLASLVIWLPLVARRLFQCS
ncbi:MAG: hypothetical protein WCA35_05775 [Kovacikia sp.]